MDQAICLEKNRVGQNQVRVKSDHADTDALYTTMRLLGGLLVNFRLRRPTIAKVQRLDHGREKILTRLKEAGLNLRALPIPQRISRGEDYIRIFWVEQIRGGLACSL